MMNSQDVKDINLRNKTVSDVEYELSCLKNGFRPLEILSAATPGHGITVLSQHEIDFYFKSIEDFQGRITKFVPASGAASRMFKDLFTALSAVDKGEHPGEKEALFLSRFMDFPFANGKNLLEFILEDKALNYGNTPKGLIQFHRYEDGTVRTAFEEHIAESGYYAVSADQCIYLHFTVSPEYLDRFKAEEVRIVPDYEKKYGCTYHIDYSIQDPSTDTVAVTPDNELFRKEDGHLLFRPAGHGALIHNLEKIDSDIIVIKNIDNVVRESKLYDTVMWKKVLMGLAVEHKHAIDNFVAALSDMIDEKRPYNKNIVDSAAEFAQQVLYAEVPDTDTVSRSKYLLALLDRPFRVCGMVKNEGAPGGGPFVVKEKPVEEGGIGRSLQILESSQIDRADVHAMREFQASTHFNPVDLVCCIKDRHGRNYPLQDFVDRNAGFISSKSYDGRDLKALELPGLWNGAMSRWNTVFVEVPSTTFNPVKTVFDLLDR